MRKSGVSAKPHRSGTFSTETIPDFLNKNERKTAQHRLEGNGKDTRERFRSLHRRPGLSHTVVWTGERNGKEDGTGSAAEAYPFP